MVRDTITISEENGMFGVAILEPDGKITKLPADNKVEAEEIAGNAANKAAARIIARAAEGGKEYRAEAFAMNVMRFVASEILTANKLKAKELTAEKIAEVVESIDPADIESAMERVRNLLEAYQTLRSKFQAPMKGNRKPSDVAAAAALLIVTSPGAAQKESARQFVVSSI